jgi:hypothetical protein
VKRIIAIAALVAAGAFASVATATWNGLNFPRNGSYYAVPGTYYDTPEVVNLRHTGGASPSNIGYQLRRTNGTVIWSTGVYASTIGMQTFYTGAGPFPMPNYADGVRIWVKAGPADGATVGVYACGGQGLPSPGAGC